MGAIFLELLSVKTNDDETTRGQGRGRFYHPHSLDRKPIRSKVGFEFYLDLFSSKLCGFKISKLVFEFSLLLLLVLYCSIIK